MRLHVVLVLTLSFFTRIDGIHHLRQSRDTAWSRAGKSVNPAGFERLEETKEHFFNAANKALFYLPNGNRRPSGAVAGFDNAVWTGNTLMLRNYPSAVGATDCKQDRYETVTRCNDIVLPPQEYDGLYIWSAANPIAHPSGIGMTCPQPGAIDGTHEVYVGQAKSAEGGLNGRCNQYIKPSPTAMTYDNIGGHDSATRHFGAALKACKCIYYKYKTFAYAIGGVVTITKQFPYTITNAEGQTDADIPANDGGDPYKALVTRSEQRASRSNVVPRRSWEWTPSYITQMNAYEGIEIVRRRGDGSLWFSWNEAGTGLGGGGKRKRD